MEDYIEERAREATWEYWKDDEEMMGSWFMGNGSARTIWEQNHPKEMEEFKQEYLRQVAQDVYEQTKEELAKKSEN
jgi:hypothetical protein